MPLPELIAKLGAAAAERGGLFKKAYTELFAPETVSPLAKQADPLVAEAKQAIRQPIDALHAEGDQRFAFFESIPDEHRILYMDNINEGRAMEGEVGRMAKEQRLLLDHAEEIERGAGIEFGHRENYFPLMFKNPERAMLALEGLKQTLGTTGFYKMRFWDTIKEAMAADPSLELASTNPETIVARRVSAAYRNVELINLLKSLEKIGAAYPYKSWSEIPTLARFPGHLVIAPDGSQWVIHNEVNALWKNAIASQSLWEKDTLGGAIFRGWMKVKNPVVAIRLAVSLFHPVHILSLDNSARMSAVLENMAKGSGATGEELLRAMNPRIGSLLSFGAKIDDLQTLKMMNGIPGIDIIKAWKTLDQSKLSAAEQLAVKLLKEGGLQPTIPEELKVEARRAFKKALYQKNIVGIGWHGARRILENMQGLIFERWIPSLKISSYLKAVDSAMRQDPTLVIDALKRKTVLREIGKSIDNRYGEMTYNTLFWNRMLKDVGVGSMLSLGWNLGFIREMGAGLFIDTPKYLAAVATGKVGPLEGITRKMWFTYLYSAQTMMLNGLITWSLTGHPPQEIMDYVYPWLGSYNSDGSKRRLTTPFFAREFFGAYKHLSNEGVWGIFNFLNAKTMLHPITELIHNRDYYGYDIVDPNAPIWKEATQLASYLWGQAKPITFEQVSQLEEVQRPNLEKSLAFMGFPPAPKYASETRIEGEIYTLFRRRVGEPSRPQPERERHQLRQKLREAISSGNANLVSQLTHQALAAGVPPRGLKVLGVPSDILAFRALPIDDQRALLSRMSYEELSRYGWYANKRLNRELATLNPEAARFLQDARTGRVHLPRRGFGAGGQPR